MELAATHVHANLEEAREKQKSWHDRRMLEKEHSNLESKFSPCYPQVPPSWSPSDMEPYKVIRAVGKVNYIVRFQDQRK